MEATPNASTEPHIKLKRERKVNSMGFDQKMEQLWVATNFGFLVFDYPSLEPRLEVEDNDFFMPNVRKVAPLYKTNIFALITTVNSPKAKVNTVYIYEHNKKAVVKDYETSTAITNVFLEKDLLIFCTFDELYMLEVQDTFKIRKVVKACANVGECVDLVLNAKVSYLAYRFTPPDVVRIQDLEFKTDEETQFVPFKDNQEVSMIKFSPDANCIAAV